MKAAVLPVPVRACPMQSRPVRAIGMKATWIGLGVSYPIFVIILSVAGARPSCANVEIFSVRTSNANSRILRQAESHLSFRAGFLGRRNSHRASAQRMAITGSRGKKPWNCNSTPSIEASQHFSQCPVQDGGLYVARMSLIEAMGFPSFGVRSVNQPKRPSPYQTPQESDASLLEESGVKRLDFGD